MNRCINIDEGVCHYWLREGAPLVMKEWVISEKGCVISDEEMYNNDEGVCH